MSLVIILTTFRGILRWRWFASWSLYYLLQVNWKLIFFTSLNFRCRLVSNLFRFWTWISFLRERSWSFPLVLPKILVSLIINLIRLYISVNSKSRNRIIVSCYRFTCGWSRHNMLILLVLSWISKLMLLTDRIMSVISMKSNGYLFKFFNLICSIRKGVHIWLLLHFALYYRLLNTLTLWLYADVISSIALRFGLTFKLVILVCWTLIFQFHLNFIYQ